MAKRIIDMIQTKKASMQKNAAEAGQNATLAVAAMKGGIRSQEWRAYMMQFAEQGAPGVPVDPDHLSRLLATDGTLGIPELDSKRAYLIANAICGDQTTGTFANFVNTIDVGITSGCLASSPTAKPPYKKPKARKKAAKKTAKKKSAAKK
jgi:hypothetical protein